MAASDTTPATNAMIAATSRMRSRPVVKAARVIVPATCRAGAGSRAITLPICPDCTAPAISGPRADSPGTAAARVSTSSFASLENSVPSRAMPVAMPTWRKVELMPEAMPACCGGTTPTVEQHREDGGAEPERGHGAAAEGRQPEQLQVEHRVRAASLHNNEVGEQPRRR